MTLFECKRKLFNRIVGTWRQRENWTKFVPCLADSYAFGGVNETGDPVAEVLRYSPQVRYTTAVRQVEVETADTKITLYKLQQADKWTLEVALPTANDRFAAVAIPKVN